MSAFIARQPNGLYCRFSTVLDCPTHWNITREQYLNNITGSVPYREYGEDVLKNHVVPFFKILEDFQPRNMAEEEFKKIVEAMSVGMIKEDLKRIVCELIDYSDMKKMSFYQGNYSNIYEHGITFSLEGGFVTRSERSGHGAY